MTTRHGGADRISTKARLAGELAILGRVIAHAREHRGLKQGDVAAKLGMPASYLSKIESGTRRLDVIELIQLARAIGTEAAALIAEVERALTARP